MSELLFSAKCLVLTLVLTLFMQLPVAGEKAETHLYRAATNSQVVDWVHTAGLGGALFLQSAYDKIKTQVMLLINGNEEDLKSRNSKNKQMNIDDR